MTFVLTHGAAWVLAGLCIWWLWRRVDAGHDSRITAVVTLGLHVRALGGVALFWISWLGLPIASSLQAGDGFWFYAPDAVRYYETSELTALAGLKALLFINRELPSAFYSQALGILIYLLGSSPAAALFLNVIAYLTTAVLVMRWGRRVHVERWTVIVVLCGISFFPSWILWSFQPLKDTFFLMLMVAYASAASAWLDSPADDTAFVRTNLKAVVWLALLFHPIASIRWYVAGILAGATVLAWMPVLITTARRRLARAGMVGLFSAITFVMLPYSAGPFLPPFAQQLFRLASLDGLTGFAGNAAGYLEEKRNDSLATPADTMIQAARTADTSAQAAESVVDRIFPRAVAMFLPRFVGTALGWVVINGGRSLWALAEVDTLFFDLVLLAVAWRLWREYRRGLALRPVVVVVALTTAMLAGAVCYQTANFGTQFRLRSMVAIGILLMPLTLGRTRDAGVQAAREPRVYADRT